MFKIKNTSNEQLLAHPDLTQLSEKHNRSLLVHLPNAITIVFAVLALSLFLFPLSPMVKFQKYYANSMFIVLAIASVWISGFSRKLFDQNGVLSNLSGMTALRRKGNDYCQEAFDLAKQYTFCQTHISKALAQGREILLLDLWYMNQLVSIHKENTIAIQQRFGGSLSADQKNEWKLLNIKIWVNYFIMVPFAILLYGMMMEFRGAGFTWVMGLMMSVVIIGIFISTYLGDQFTRSALICENPELIHSLEKAIEKDAGFQYISKLREQGRAISCLDVMAAHKANRRTNNICRELHGMPA